MSPASSSEQYRSFLGTGWSFPPTFCAGGVVMTSDEEDIQASLHILFHTAPGERFLQPNYGLDMAALLFEPLSTTMRTLLTDRVRTVILIHEPRIVLVNLFIDDADTQDGVLRILLEYDVRATNSRFNLVFPFYRSDSNEVRAAVGGGTRA